MPLEKLGDLHPTPGGMPRVDVVIVQRLDTLKPGPEGSVITGCKTCDASVVLHPMAAEYIGTEARILCLACAVTEFPAMVDALAEALNKSSFVAMATKQETIDSSIEALWAADPAGFITPYGFKVEGYADPEPPTDLNPDEVIGAIITGPGLPPGGLPFPVPKSARGKWARRLCILLNGAFETGMHARTYNPPPPAEDPKPS